MFNSTILDVIIGLIFVYLLLSILCTAANEWVAALSKRRAITLQRGITQLLAGQSLSGDGNTLLSAFYKHPLIKTMFNGEHPPTYLSPRNFATAVTDIISDAPDGPLAFEDLLKKVNAMPDGDVKTSLLALLRHTGNDINEARDAIEGWFNDAMDRVSGWYKRRTQLWTIIIALLLTLVANADTIQITRRLWTDPVLRSAVVEEAKVRAQKPRPTVSVEYQDENDPTNPTVTRNEGNQLSDNERDLLGQLIGWHSNWKQTLNWFTPLGWLLTVLAISMGAPFWFDMLNKVMNIRFAGKSPSEKAKAPEKTVRA